MCAVHMSQKFHRLVNCALLVIAKNKIWIMHTCRVSDNLHKFGKRFNVVNSLSLCNCHSKVLAVENVKDRPCHLRTTCLHRT